MSFLQVQKAQELIQTDSQLHDQLQQQISQCPRDSEQNLELRQMLQPHLINIELYVFLAGPEGPGVDPDGVSTPRPDPATDQPGTRGRTWSSDRCSSCISINIELCVFLAGPEGPGVDPDGVSTPAADQPVTQGFGAEPGAPTDAPAVSL